MNFGGKFVAWVFFHTAISQSRKFQENLRRTVVVLPLRAYLQNSSKNIEKKKRNASRPTITKIGYFY